MIAPYDDPIDPARDDSFTDGRTVPASIHAGDVLAGRYRMVDLLDETEGGWFWRAYDSVLHRHVAVHVIAQGDQRGPALMEAARRSASLADRRNLRVLDTDQRDGICYVVNEWGSGESLDITLADQGPLPARQAAWLVAEVADTLAYAHDAGLSHGRLVPENVLVDDNGQVRIIGFGVDAALHGLPPDRAPEDVIDLAGLLYAALTGKWPGASESAVPTAPRDHEGVLRPRRVRAGIPRALDTLCDQVLRIGRGESGPHRGASGLTLPGMGGRRPDDVPRSPHAIRDALEEFLGEVASGNGPLNGSAASDAGGGEAGPLPGEATRLIPAGAAGPDPTGAGTTGAGTTGAAATDPAPAGPPTTDAGATGSDATGTGPASSADVPTEAGMPVFHDDDADEVEWFRARAHKPAPPPPFEDPPERPLFAPDPQGGSARRPRPPRPAPTASRGEYWPWDTSTGAGTGSGYLQAVGTDDVPGHRWMQAAWLVGGLALVLLAVVAAYQLGGGGGLTDSGDPEPSGSPEASETSLTPVADATVRDFDPQGDPPEEYPELVGNAVDGDPATAWRTSTYDQQLGPGGLKSGVGLQLDLGEVTDVSQVQVRVLGGETSATVFVTEEPPAGVDGLEASGEVSGADQLELSLDEPVQGRYVTVWLTALPQAAGGYRGQVAEVVVLG